VQLDTGSSDLWVQGPNKKLPNVEHTVCDPYSISAQIADLLIGTNFQPHGTYPTFLSFLNTDLNSVWYWLGIRTRWLRSRRVRWVKSRVSLSRLMLMGSYSIDVPKQALLDVSEAVNPAFIFKAQGILGLGFTSLSTIDFLVNKTGASTGRSFLFNAFATNKSEPNFIAFALSQGTHGVPANEEFEGSFAIGEYEDKFKHIAETDKIPTWPPHAPTRWNVLLDAIIVNQTITTVTTEVTDAPSNRAVAMLDSGTSYTYVSQL
jgi:hypothetical protein